MIFAGTQYSTVDAKGRVVIPATHRKHYAGGKAVVTMFEMTKLVSAHIRS